MIGNPERQLSLGSESYRGRAFPMMITEDELRFKEVLVPSYNSQYQSSITQLNMAFTMQRLRGF